MSQELYHKKSEYIHKKVFKPYIKYLCMIVVGVGIIKRPTSTITELKEYEGYASQIENKESIFINVQEEKKNLTMLLEALYKD